MSARTVLIPDLDEEITHALTALEEVLLTLDGAEADGMPVPGALAGGAALAAVRRLWSVLAPTQGDRARRAGLTGRLLAPDGRHEHIPLRVVDVEAADVDQLAAAARALGDPHADELVHDAVDEVGDAVFQPGDMRAGVGRRLVVAIAALAGVLDLADTPAAVMLRDRLAAAAHADGPAADVVLTEAEERAYGETVTRINQMWSQGDPLQRWAY
ncbi:hypothetical protein [Actinomadura sp. 6N118]|uniref:hypothetical protein n=1 Tax=Actinomadura sp. 6N118 TaxID=3375151 RepID=UPI003798BD79